jgi:hypothetical protein
MTTCAAKRAIVPVELVPCAAPPRHLRLPPLDLTDEEPFIGLEREGLKHGLEHVALA